MPTVVFSDCHLTAKFDPAKFLYLQNIIESADRVIINGDFWDGYMANFTDLLNSERSKLFKLLSNKETYYVCGNHDAAALHDPRIDQFARWCGEMLELTIDGQKYRFEHGHRIAPTLDQIYPGMFRRSWVAKTATAFEYCAARIIGQNYFAVHRPANTKMKLWQRHNLSTDQILVCGHSHWPEANELEKYFNTGFVRHRLAHHLVINHSRRSLINGRY